MDKTKLVSVTVFCIFLFGLCHHGASQERIVIKTPFKPVNPVYPGYPEFLKEEGVAARVRVLVYIGASD